MRRNRRQIQGRPGARATIRPALALAAAVLATGFAATASAAPVAPATTGAPTGGRTVPAPFLAPPPKGEKVTVTSHFVWRATADTLNGDATFIVNGATNGKKNDLLFVMPNLTPGGLSPCPCLLSRVPPVGVWYNGSRWAIFNEDGANFGTLFAYNVLVVPKASKSAFEVHATASNRHGNYMIINSPATNGHPNALIQVTQHLHSPGTFNPHNVGVRYFTARHRWAIFNEDGAAMPAKASFNVLVGNAASNGGRTNVLTATATNLKSGEVVISNPETTGNPNNVVFATQNFNPGGKGGTANNGFLVAGYNNTHEGIFNWAGPADIPLKAAFNLLIFSS